MKEDFSKIEKDSNSENIPNMDARKMDIDKLSSMNLDDLMKVRNLGRKQIDAVLSRLDEIELDNTPQKRRPTNMMICPESYLETIKDKPFDQLIEERKTIEHEIEQLEDIVFSKNSVSSETVVSPGPDVKYQMNLEYLAALCKFMKNKYNQEIVFGDDE